MIDPLLFNSNFSKYHYSVGPCQIALDVLRMLESLRFEPGKLYPITVIKNIAIQKFVDGQVDVHCSVRIVIGTNNCGTPRPRVSDEGPNGRKRVDGKQVVCQGTKYMDVQRQSGAIHDESGRGAGKEMVKNDVRARPGPAGP